MDIGQRIKKRRKELGLSAEQLGEKLGKNRATIYRYENGDIENLPLDILEPIAAALATTPQYLMGWEKVQKNNDALTDIVVRMRTDVNFAASVAKLHQLNPEQLASVTQIADVLLKG